MGKKKFHIPKSSLTCAIVSNVFQSHIDIFAISRRENTLLTVD